MLHYLSLRQGSNVPYTPVKTPEEKKLFNQLVSQLLQENKRLSRDDTFEELTQRWNQIATGSNNIYCKYAQQLRSYYKLWKKTKMRKDAVSATDEKMLRAALEHVPKLLRSEKLRESRVLASEPTAASHPSRALTDNLEQSVSVGENVDSTDEGVDANEAPVQHQQSMAQPQAQEQQQQPTAPRRVLVIGALQQYPYHYQPQHQMQHYVREFSVYRHSSSFSELMSQPCIGTRKCRVNGCPDPDNCPGNSNRDNCIGLR